MMLHSGDQVGPFAVEAALGAGGMGEVYRARDTRLDREVAVKVLPEVFARDAERLARFEREAKLLAALNHPNIAAIYGLEQASGAPVLVLEYVPGETLRSPLEVEEALRVAAQIAEALEAAHERGIIHRDLKPANIKITPEGKAKVPDFGLAKALIEEAGAESPSVSQSPTMTAGATRAGVILGTAAYMSPEQARGKAVDTRADIWAFGCVLFEMLTGRSAFAGESVADVLGAVIRAEPDMTQLPAATPPSVRRVLRRCLQKDPSRRLRDIGDARLELLDCMEQPRGTAEEVAQPRISRGATAGAALALVVATAAVTWQLTRSTAVHSSTVLRQVTFDSGLTTDPALSPDGKWLAYASDRSGENNLDIWIQQVAGGQQIRLTRDAADDYAPDVSPDGSKVAFRSERDGGGIFVVSSLGGEERLLAVHGRRPRFSPDGNWIAYFASNSTDASKIYVVPATGGPPREVETGLGFAAVPIWSPDGKYLLFSGRGGVGAFSGFPDWCVVSVQGGHAVPIGATSILRLDAIASLIGTPPGAWIGDYILYSVPSGSARNLWRMRLSNGNWRMAGPPERLTVGSAAEMAPSAATGNGAAGMTLAFASVNRNVNLWSLPIEPRQGATKGPAERVSEGASRKLRPTISADGRKLVFVSSRGGPPHVWLRDMIAGKETALTSTPAGEAHPQISADGSKLCYTVSGTKKPIYVITLVPRPGTPELVCEDCGNPMGWSPDGKNVIYYRTGPLRWGILDAATRRTAELFPPINREIHNARFSPDGNWLAFNVPADGKIYVAPFRNGAAAASSEWALIGEGEHPWWSADGGILYFTSTRDGFQCVWAQRVSDKGNQPADTPFEFYPFHGAGRSAVTGNLGWAITADRLVLPVEETTGNIWLANFESAGR